MPEQRWPRRFHDRLGFRMHSSRDILKIMTSGGFSDMKKALPLGAHVPRVESPRVPASSRAPAVTWAGHASFVVQLEGLTFLTDPVWSTSLPGRIPRISPVGVPWSDLPRVDGVLVSHNHYDHLDAPTMRRLPRDTPVFAPARLGAWFRAKGFRRVTELDWWEGVEHRGVRLELVPAQHWSRRLPWDTNATLWGGWVAKPADAPAGGVYFAGDSGYCAWFKEIGRRHPGLDVALMPIGAYEPRWFMRPVHMNPEEAVQAFVDVGARRFVPMHWGTFSLTREPLLEPPERLRAEWKARGLPPEALWDLALGETRSV